MIKAEWTNADALNLQTTCKQHDCISRQAAIDVFSLGKEILSRVLDDVDVVGVDREKYSWGLGLIESYIEDIEELPSAKPVAKDINVPVKDTIIRQAAIDTLADMYRAAEKWRQEASNDEIKARAESCMASIVEMKLRIKNLPTAQPEPNYDEWCTDCKEYDTERHSCPRWNRVIRQTVDDLKDAQSEIIRCTVKEGI